MSTPAETAFQARTDLITEYGDNARLLFALQLRYDIDDVESVAATALVDGPDDKNCDLVFVDRSRGVVIVAQGYESRTDKTEAKSKKADDLNTAIAWLFQRAIPDIPERLRSAAHEVREAIGSGDINAIEFWYVHNLPESANVKSALDTVRLTARNILEQTFGLDRLPERIDAVEVGLGAQDEWYKSLEVHILVNDPFNLTVSGAFEIAGTGWRAVVTAVKAAWLHDIYLQHREKLFSANYREYLGVKMKRSRNEINIGIQHTAREDAGNFWVYNNGISAIVADYALGADANCGSLTVTGLSIVNGAQTTGAIGNLAKRPSDDALVPIRFIKCNDDETVSEIVRFNNSQNPLLPSDFKSNDTVQRRLRDEFKTLGSCKYLGGRRGIDRLSSLEGLIPSDSAAQALAAFHQRPDIAYHQKAEIWRDDALYELFFRADTTARHVLFAFSLLKAVEEKKQQLRLKGISRTEQEEQQFGFFCKRGAILLLTAALAGSLESILGKKVPTKFRLSFQTCKSPRDGITKWQPIVDMLVAFSAQLTASIEIGLKDEGNNTKAVASFGQNIQAMRAITATADVFNAFSAIVVET